MKIYVGSRDFKPDGFVTVDIDETMKPDIVGDIRDLTMLEDECCNELIASAVLEHIDWPDGFLALSEFARILKVGGIIKISVPDLGMMARMILNGESVYSIVGMIYGLGGRGNKYEQHRYGYTIGMLVDILEVLGFGSFDWWNSDLPDAANGWLNRTGGNIAVPMNVSATKKSKPMVPPRDLFHALEAAPDADFLGVAAKVAESNLPITNPEEPAGAKLYQLIHFRLLDARQRIKYLEGLLNPI